MSGSRSFGSGATSGAPPCAPAGVAVTLRELIALRPEARRLGLGAGAHGLAAGGGGHLSRLRGPGVEYVESRPYTPGDDPRGMDWRVTARSAVPHVKVWREARERPVWLLVDQGPAMRFGTRVAFKSVVAARAAALLAWGALAHGDRVGGGVLGHGAVGASLLTPPARRVGAVLALLAALARATEHGIQAGGAVRAGRLAPRPAAPVGFCAALLGAGRQGRAPASAGAGSTAAAKGDPGGALGARPEADAGVEPSGAGALARVQPGSLVFLISDFADLTGTDPAWLPRLADHSAVVLALVYDPLEATGPPAGRWAVTDGAERRLLDLDSPGRRALFANRFGRRHEVLTTLARRHGAHCLLLATDQPVGRTLVQAFGGRGPRFERRSAPGR